MSLKPPQFFSCVVVLIRILLYMKKIIHADITKLIQTDSSKIPPVRSNNPRGYWSDTFHQRAFMNELAEKLNITDQEGWYKVTTKSFLQHGGMGLLEKYNNSPSKLLSTVYPEYKWDVTKFIHLPHQFWDDTSNQRVFLENLAKELNIVNQDGWGKLTRTAIYRHGGGGLFVKYGGSVTKALVTVFPKYRQSFRELVLSIVEELKLPSVAAVRVDVPLTHIKARGGPWLHRLTTDSFGRCTFMYVSNNLL